MIVAEGVGQAPSGSGQTSQDWFGGFGATWEAVDHTSRMPRRLGTFEADDQTDADMIAHERWPNAIKVVTHLVVSTSPPKPGEVLPTIQPTPPQPSAGSRIHIVERGDSLSLIAQRHGQPASAWRDLYNINRVAIGRDPNRVAVGLHLILPRSWVGPVRPQGAAVPSSRRGWVVAGSMAGIATLMYVAWWWVRRRRWR